MPTVTELGYDVQMLSERGIGMPKGVDEAIVTRLSDALGKIAADPAFVEANTARFTEVHYLGQKDFAAHIEQLKAAYKKMWDEAPWQ